MSVASVQLTLTVIGRSTVVAPDSASCCPVAEANVDVVTNFADCAVPRSKPATGTDRGSAPLVSTVTFAGGTGKSAAELEPAVESVAHPEGGGGGGSSSEPQPASPIAITVTAEITTGVLSRRDDRGPEVARARAGWDTAASVSTGSWMMDR